jgi:hypothetical protein
MEVETIRVQASRFETAGGLRGSLAVNPVFLVSGARP